MEGLLKKSAPQAREAYAASLVRKHPDEFLPFATHRRLTREWNNRNPDGCDHPNLSFNAFLKLRYPEDWVAYQAYLRLINKE